MHKIWSGATLFVYMPFSHTLLVLLSISSSPSQAHDTHPMTSLYSTTIVKWHINMTHFKCKQNKKYLFIVFSGARTPSVLCPHFCHVMNHICSRWRINVLMLLLVLLFISWKQKWLQILFFYISNKSVMSTFIVCIIYSNGCATSL